MSKVVSKKGTQDWLHHNVCLATNLNFPKCNVSFVLQAVLRAQAMLE